MVYVIYMFTSPSGTKYIGQTKNGTGKGSSWYKDPITNKRVIIKNLGVN